MKVLIFGGTGFIGKQLIPLLVKEGYEVVMFTRNPGTVSESFPEKVKIVGWNTNSILDIKPHFTGEYGVINLAGESIGSKLWTRKQKDRIRSSRLSITNAITDCIRQSSDKPVVLLQGSAIGFYGSRADSKLLEDSTRGVGFLSDVVNDWEKPAKALQIEMRVVIVRTGIVLGSNGGILPLMILPFKFYFGGYPGNGKQWFSWIHISDLIKAILFLLQTKTASGIYNVTSNEPVQMKLFAKTAGRILRKPAWLPVPAFIFKLLLPGGMAKDLILTSQRVFPGKLMKEGFQFEFENINKALENLLLKK